MLKFLNYMIQLRKTQKEDIYWHTKFLTNASLAVLALQSAP